MDVSKRLMALRKQYGYTQNGLAEKAGVSQTHLRRVELGQADITVSHLELICDAMNITLGEFFADDRGENDLAIAVSKLSPRQKRSLLVFLESL